MEPSEGGGAKKVVLHCFFLWDTTLAFGLEGSTAVANPGFKVRVGRELFFFFIYSGYSGWGSKIGLLCEFRDAIPLG
jgi:hypothetical protein